MKNLIYSVLFTASLLSSANLYAIPDAPDKVLKSAMESEAFKEDFTFMAGDRVNRVEIKLITGRVSSSTAQVEGVDLMAVREFCKDVGGQSRSGSIVALIAWQDKYNAPSEIREIRFYATPGGAEFISKCGGE